MILKNQYGLIKDLLFSAIVLACASLAAVPVTPQKAHLAAESWLRNRSGARLGAQLRGMPAQVLSGVDRAGRTLFHVARLEEDGYVITSADDELEPIIAFSETGTFADSSENPLASLLRRDMAERLDLHVRTATGQLKTAASGSSVGLRGRGAEEVEESARRCRAAWSDLLDGATNAVSDTAPRQLAQSRSSVSDVRVPVLMSTKWNQSEAGGSACYNYYTPNGYVCGCVATAGAQLMRYHCHPKNSLQSVSRSCWVDDSVRSFSTKGGAFDWSNMPYAPGSSTTKVQRQAIGKLCYDVGVASRMNWTYDGSGAMLPTLGENLVEMFGYAQARSQLSGSLTTLELKNAIFANLDAGCPVLLGIEDAYGKNGHAIVADGYGYSEQTVYTHLNLGWSGSSDAWYALPDIGTSYRFSCVDAVVYNVFPNKTGDLLTGRVLTSDGSALAGATIRATNSGSVRTAVSNERGIYAIYLEGGNTWDVIATASGYGEAETSVYVPACSDCEIVNLTSSGCSYHRGSVGNSWGNDFRLSKGVSSSLEIAPSSLSFSAASGSQTVTITCSGGWQVSSSDSWVTLNVTSGSGNGTLRVNVAANAQLPREASVVVTCGTVRRKLSVSQAGATRYGHLTIENGVVVSWDGQGSTDIVIPEGVVRIGESVFKQSDITSVTFPNSLEEIDALAFALCYSLTNVTWGTGLKKIGGQAFGADRGLSGCLTLPSGVQKIEYCAFWGIGATWIVLPASLERVDWGAFNGCSNLSRVYFEGDAPSLDALSYYDLSGDRVVESSELFRGTDAQMQVMVPYGSRGWSAANSTALPALWPVGDVDDGDARAIVHYDVTMTKLALDQDVVQLLGQAQSVNVSVQAEGNWWASTDASWISFVASAGTGFSSLVLKVAENRQSAERTGSVVVQSGNASVCLTVRQGAKDAEFLIEDGVLKAWRGNGSGRVVIPSGVREIGEKVFYCARDLKEAIIPAGVKKIGQSAFSVCGALTNVVLNADLEEIEGWAFSLDHQLVGRLYIPSSVKRIGTDAFWETGYSSVVFLGTPDWIGNGVFQGCESLKNVYFKENAPRSMGESYSPNRPNLYEGTAVELTTWAVYGSTGWQSAQSSALPSLWPVDDGEHARAIRNYYVIEDYSIAVDLDGGQWTGRIPEFVRREEWIGLPAPTKVGFEFAGWQAVSGLDPVSARYSADGVTVHGWTSPWSAVGAGADGITVTALSANGAVTLRALWTKVQAYDIRYQLDGGAFAVTAPTRARQGEWLVLPSPVRAGFDFGGWQAVSGLDTSCASVSVDGVQAYNWWPFDAVVGAGLDAFIISNLARDGGVVTLRALWNARTYSIRYQLDGGTLGANTPSTLGEGVWAVLPSPVRPGYSFGGWQAVSGLDMSCAVVSTDGVTAYQWWPSDAVVGAGLEAFIVSDLARAHGQVTLRALWQANAYSINYWLGGGTLSVNTPTSARPGEWFVLPSPTRPGYSFGGWQAISGLDSSCAVVSTDGVTAYQWWPSDAVVGAGLNSFIASDLTRAGGAVMLMALWNYAWPIAAEITPKQSAASAERSLPSGEYPCRLEDTGDFGMIGIGTPDAEGFMPIRLELDMEDCPLAGCGRVEDGVLVARFEDGRTISFVRSGDDLLLGSILKFNLTHQEGEQTK